LQSSSAFIGHDTNIFIGFYFVQMLVSFWNSYS